MAGPAVAGELTATRGGVRYAVATAVDEAALRRLLRTNPMHGAISLTFEREPDYFAGADSDGAADMTIVAYEGQQLLCMGRCATRSCWINGAPRRVAYLGELRLDAAAAGRLDILRGGYEFFREQQRANAPDVTFTSIAADNARARRFLERGVRGLPRYDFLSELVTLVIPVRRTPPPPATCDPPDTAELIAHLNTEGRRHQLATVWSEQRLAALAAHGLTRADFICERDSVGRIVGVAAVWDQRSFRQTVIRAYDRRLAAVRPLVNTAAKFLQTPRLPAVGEVLAHAYVSPLAVASDHAHALFRLVDRARFNAAQRGLEFITVGFMAGDPHLAEIQRRFRHRAYRSRLYRVSWPSEHPLRLASLPLMPELALL